MAQYRILHTLDRMDRAGAETLIVTIMRSLDPARYQFDFLVRAEEPAQYDAELIQSGCRIFRCPHRPNLPVYMKTAYDIMRNEGPYQAVHSHLHFFDGITLTIARAAGIPVRISHSHSTSDGCERSWARGCYNRVMAPAIRSSATHRVAVSKEAYSALFKEPYEPGERRTIVRNGVPLFPYEAPNILDLRKELCLPEESLLIGHVGRMIASKNHEFLLAVFAELRRSEPQAELILVGDGPLRTTIGARARELNVSEHVHFLGIRDDVARILSSFDGFVFPSLYEGVPLALVEAQAAGVFCLVSKTISAEADIGCGLVQFLDLDAGSAAWAVAIGTRFKFQVVSSWHLRRSCLRSSGYDMENVAQQWMRMYSA